MWAARFAAAALTLLVLLPLVTRFIAAAFTLLVLLPLVARPVVAGPHAIPAPSVLDAEAAGCAPEVGSCVSKCWEGRAGGVGASWLFGADGPGPWPASSLLKHAPIPVTRCPFSPTCWWIT